MRPEAIAPARTPSICNALPARFGARLSRAASLAATILVALTISNSHAAVPNGYQGTPFDPEAYRAEQAALASRPWLPYHAFTRILTLWDSKNPKGSGWVGPEEPGATIGLAESDRDGKRFIQYHVKLNHYRYAAFGWRWANPHDKSVDLRQYDAVSFSICVSGPKRPQELFFGVDEIQPAPVSLHHYDPDFLDGTWHRIVIPVSTMKWSGTNALEAQSQVRGFALRTFVWDPAEFDVQLDEFALERNVDSTGSSNAKLPAPNVLPSGKPQTIPGRIECAFYDLGGEGVAYHDTTPINTLSGVLNQQVRHQRPHATPYEWSFRKDEGVDISYTKDWADLNHTNFFSIGANQLYIGGAEDGEWCEYTVEVKRAGSYRILAAYGNDAHGQSFQLSLNHHPACACKVPLVTGSMHKWNKAEVGTIEFSEAGPQLLTLYYGRGFNLAYLEFEPAAHHDG